MSPKRFYPLALLALIALAIYAGGEFRDEIGIGYSPKLLKAYFLGLGPMAPVLFVGVVAFRLFLLLPSMLLLTVGGLVFGALFGTFLGGFGIMLSGLAMFGAARGIGRGVVEHYVGDRFPGFEKHVEAAGPVLVGLTTAHPMGPMTPFHLAAGLSSMRVERFFIAIALAGIVRSAACSYFGSTLIDIGSREFFTSTAVFLAVILLPLLHPGFRQRILGRKTG